MSKKIIVRFASVISAITALVLSGGAGLGKF
jgi:hypothetical protein